MKFTLNLNAKSHTVADLVVVGAYAKPAAKEEAKKTTKKATAKKAATTEAGIVNNHWEKEIKTAFEAVKNSKNFKATKGEKFTFTHNGHEILVLGLGEKAKLESEDLRKELAKLSKDVSKYSKVALQFDGLQTKGNTEDSLQILVEAFTLAAYKFDKYLSDAKKSELKEVVIDSTEKSAKAKKLQAVIDDTLKVTDAINYARDLVNEPPNVLRSTEYAKRIKADVAKIKGVKCKVLGKTEMKKEKMDLFLSVNNGSGFDAQLVHLTYTPAKANSKTKHIALVGKGLVFDTGGYSLKPGGSMMNMKFDMAGSATVYAAFRAAANLGLNVKITCILGITDNAVNELATMPDSIVKARNGKTVEILNTDAEGRLVLADCLDYACDQKPDAIIDAATLTGACLVALGGEVCGLMSNNDKLAQSLLKSAKSADEYMWQLPIIPEWTKDMKGTISDLKNIGSSGWGGTAKAAAFLQEFIKDDIAWAHLDIAGVGDSQSHLPYCPAKGASGTIVRSLLEYLKSNA
ncbi:M17 family metallopeptidase [Bacteriovorax sp. Seq25_V]|uniref:leucyl aminopeptidase family protein n=1 Tax=Bacteriovorax sp. Seq25_V TaxID=1201288 RepID=UPI000389F4C3|nr:leucyl aminopeptidase [Bacteriovorax sp. Seq25_V]EQC44721.1 cytosol aminopeptidase family, catalytic domain protein [Bacteriovorax sp. Seq25_V]